MQPGLVRRPGSGPGFALGAVGTVAVLLAGVGVVFAATSPDGIQKLGLQTGIASQARTLLSTPLAGYQASFLGSGWMGKAGAGMAGLALIYGACLLLGRLAARNRSV